MTEVYGKSQPISEAVDRFACIFCGDLPAEATLFTVKVSVIRRGPDMKLFAAIPAMGVADDPKVLEDAEGAIHRRWGRRRIDGTTPVDELASSDVPIRRAKDFEE